VLILIIRCESVCAVLSIQRQRARSECVSFLLEGILLRCVWQPSSQHCERIYRSRDVFKNESGLECITISRRFFSSIVLSLLENNKSIHVWTKRQGGDWVVQCQASPGYTQEIEKEITSEESKLLKDASVLAAIQIQIQSDEEVSTARRKKSSARSSGNQSDRKVHIGMAIMSNAANRLTLMEFKDDVKFSRYRFTISLSSC
jgi:hypothetical protein